MNMLLLAYKTQQFAFQVNNMQSMSVVRAPNTFADLCSVVPCPPFAAKKKTNTTTHPKKPTHTTHQKKKNQTPKLFEMEFTPTADSASQSAAMHCTCAHGGLCDSQECSKTGQ